MAEPTANLADQAPDFGQWVKLIKTSDKEYGLAAAKPIGEYAIFMKEDAAVHTVQLQHLSYTCSFCLKTTGMPKGIKKCGSCVIVHYCSAECQKADWTIHKYECKFFTLSKTFAGTGEMREMIRIIIKAGIDKEFVKLSTV